MKAVLVTGADGYLGARIAARYAGAARMPVIAWLRAASAAEFAAKRERLSSAIGAAPAAVRFAWGDLRSPEPFSTIDPAEVGSIVHAAAVTRFNVEAELALAVNIEGTAKLLGFAQRCRSLESLGLLSSVYASGLRAGTIDERPFGDASGFANHYERSKWAAEMRLLHGYEHLPWRLFRIATVIADNASGRVTRHNAVHNTLKLLYHGLISLLPGDPATPLYFVTADFAAGSVFELMQRRAERVIYHLAPARAQALTLGALVDIAWRAFGTSADFTRRRLLPPVYVGLDSFEHLAEGVSGFGGRILAQAIGSMTPFARQLFVVKSVENRNLRAALTAPADGERLARDTCLQLVASGWGRAPC